MLSVDLNCIRSIRSKPAFMLIALNWPECEVRVGADNDKNKSVKIMEYTERNKHSISYTASNKQNIIEKIMHAMNTYFDYLSVCMKIVYL